MNRRKPQAGSARRRALLLLVPAVLLIHALLAERLGGWLAGAAQAVDAPPRLHAVFVRELRPAEPPAPRTALPLPAPKLRTPRRMVAALPPAPPASAPRATAAPPGAAAPGIAAAPDLTATPDVAAVAEAGAPPGMATVPEPALPAPAEAPSTPTAAASAAQPSGFAWPPSTRLSYSLIGDVRGEVRGEAQVEWVREGSRYQVHLDVIIGPGFAPVARRRITSDGELTPGGLAPLRYDESTRVAFGQPRRLTLRFDAGGVTLADGRRTVRPPAVQDSASQFVQLTWLFLTGAERLEAGRRIELPLALPRRIDRWIYEVVGEERLHTPFGVLPAWHLRPLDPPRPDTLAAEAWFAPSLQYLPVRILIRQGTEHHIDLMIERLPQQALAPEPRDAPGERAAAPAMGPLLR